MRKVLAVSLVAILLVVVGIGCVPSAAQPAATAPAVNINTINAEVTAIKTWQTDIASWRTTTVDPMIARINRGEIGGGTNYQSQIDSAKATLAEQNTKINDLTTRLTTAENKITTMTATPAQQPTGINTGGTTGQTVQFTPGMPPAAFTPTPSGTVVSQSNFVSGQAQIYSSAMGSSGNCWYVQRLINYNSAVQYVRPLITLALASGYNYTSTFVGGININISSPQCNMVGLYTPPNVGTASTQWPQTWPPAQAISSISTTQSATAPYLPVGTATLSIAPGLGSITNSMFIMPVGGCGTGNGEFYIAPGGYVDLTVQISGLYTQAPVLWNVSPSYSAHP